MKKLVVLFGIVLIILTMFEIMNSYAKYSSEANATVNNVIGGWNIELNGNNISNSNSNHQFLISSLTYPSNSYVLENKIAPGSSGYFDITINTAGSSVAVRVDVTIDFTELDISDAIDFESASLIDESNQVTSMTRTGENTYTGIIDLDQVEDEEVITARFYISWEEDLSGTNDEDDSRLGVLREESSLNLPVSVTVSQYNGEALVQYE